VLVGLDITAGEARVQGWTLSGGRAIDHLDRWARWPAAGVVHTAIDRDGVGAGPDVAALRAVCERYPGAVFASGGVTTIEDVEACRDAGAAGAIVGRALHDGGFDLAAALARFARGAVA
jgi:phosphoribosylformimino-5-aminoimidazole carboxamide ribonucleotide (ProFAR) isomerase